ncbi:hypothetical protein BJ912DRAFT_1094791 [Pholiota molesta]|nr:hypothetical protein BJ912DRAFT_1094791 [Pholiota molesta]
MSLFPQPAPSLPPFSTLLIAGPYHPSAPVHLAYSSSGPKSPVLLLCPSRATFKEDMLRFNDSWLNAHSATGKHSELASYVSIFYSPTSVHLSLLLSMFHVPRSGSALAESTPKTAQAVPPGLVILTEPSRYFLSPGAAEMSSCKRSYAVLISEFGQSRVHLDIKPDKVFGLDSVLLRKTHTDPSFSGDHPPKFALFDSQLENLKLPLLSEPSLRLGDDQAADEQPGLTPVLPLVENLFQWICIFEDDDSYVPSSQGEEMNSEEGVRKQLRMYRRDQNGEDDERLYHWIERRCKSRFSKLEETEFKWDPS